jgi:hypothetical protein
LTGSNQERTNGSINENVFLIASARKVLRQSHHSTRTIVAFGIYLMFWMRGWPLANPHSENQSLSTLPGQTSFNAFEDKLAASMLPLRMAGIAPVVFLI